MWSSKTKSLETDEKALAGQSQSFDGGIIHRISAAVTSHKYHQIPNAFLTPTAVLSWNIRLAA